MSIIETLLLIIASAAFLSALVWRLVGNGKRDFILGISAFIGASFAYLFMSQLIYWFSHQDAELTTDINRFISAFWWVSLAFLINASIKRYVYRRRLTVNGEPTIPLLLQHCFTLLIYLVVAMLVTRFVYGQGITALATASGAVALILGYSARSLIDEVFAGLSLNINAPMRIGDLVQINGEWGYVKDINWRCITYLDMDQNYVVLANTQLAASRIMNLDRPNKLTRRLFEFRVEYNFAPKEVTRQIELAMAECPHIVDHPWNYAAFLDCDEKGMRYRAAFHISHYDYWFVARDELVNAIWYRFARKGIRWAHQRHLNYKDAGDEKKALFGSAYNESNWRDLVERFNQVPMFEGMTSSDMEELAKCAQLHIVGPPERIIRAGSKHTSMFLIASGEADVYEVDDFNNETLMATIGIDEPIGLMSLLTGSPQRTTIRAREECAVWEISSDSLHQIFDQKPDVMTNMASSVARWQAEEEQSLNDLKMSRRQEALIINKQTSLLTKRITRFFNRSKDGEDANSVEFSNY